MQKWKVLERSYLYKTPHGNLRKDRCLIEDKNHIIDAYHVNEFENWVNAVVLTDQEEMVLIKQYRHGAEGFFYEIPAGKTEYRESYEQAIQREVLEETGYQTNTSPIYLGEFFVNPATQNNKVISYLMLHAVKVKEQDLDVGEVIDIFKIPFENVEKLVKTGELQQLFSVTAFCLAKNYLIEINTKGRI